MKKLTNIKLIATDLDMTLMNKYRKLSPRTIRVLKEVEKRGIIIVIATGRFLRDIRPEMESNGFYPYYVLINGAEARTPQGELISAIDLLDDDYLRVMKYFEEKGAVPEIYTGEGEFLVCDAKTSLEEMLLRTRIMQPKMSFDLEDMKNIPRYQKRNYVDSPMELIQRGVGVRKVICFDESKAIIRRYKEDIGKMKDVVTLSSSEFNIEVTHKFAQKGYILRDIIKKLGISEEEVVVFGDGENDTSLFQLFENSVAVDNAIPQIKDLASHITAHHDEDGVAKFIEEVIL